MSGEAEKGGRIGMIKGPEKSGCFLCGEMFPDDELHTILVESEGGQRSRAWPVCELCRHEHGSKDEYGEWHLKPEAQ